MIMNCMNQICQLISDGKILYPCFWMEKKKKDGERKKKAVIPRLAFPFCLKTVVKQGSFQKKVDFCFYKLGIK